MTIEYNISVSELKALIEIVSELCKRAGLDECVTRALFRKLNEKHFK